MTLSKDTIFEQAARAELWAGHLIPNYTSTGGKLENCSPIDNTVIGHIADGEAHDMDAAVVLRALRLCRVSGRSLRRQNESKSCCAGPPCSRKIWKNWRRSIVSMQASRLLNA